MDPTTLQEITNNFLNELATANNGEKTSFAFIKNTIPSASLVKNGEIFQVMGVGGSIFVNAMVKNEVPTLKILHFQREDQPVFSTKEIFLDFIASQYNSSASTIALNFAYDVQPVFEEGKLQAILARPSKEHAFTGLVGENLCKEIEEYIFKTKHHKIQVSAANDTICLLLSGLTQTFSNNLAAGIVGTGFNFALFLDTNTPVNLEAAGFDKFPRSKEAITIDASSNRKGEALFEKEISGAYLHRYFNILLEEKSITYPIIKTTEEVSQVAENDTSEIGSVARNVLERSAQLTACAIMGITKLKKHNMTFIMQGSLFWKGFHYKETVEKTVRDLMPEFSVEFIEVENSDILGAAKLVA